MGTPVAGSLGAITNGVDAQSILAVVCVDLGVLPGALAELAHRCRWHDVNILSLQVFPQLGPVTDEVVLSVPDARVVGRVAFRPSAVRARSAWPRG
jgi:hypothetical protein